VAEAHIEPNEPMFVLWPAPRLVKGSEGRFRWLQGPASTEIDSRRLRDRGRL